MENKLIEIGGYKYLQSQNVRVFPCSYRGYYNKAIDDSDVTLVFDPEARATTEANFTNTFQKVSNSKKSYVVDWDNAQKILKCVIDGYYFEIYNYEITDFFYTAGGTKQSYYLCIKTVEVSLGTSEPDESDARRTRVLGSFANTTNYLDIKEETDYAFTGLVLSRQATGTASLKPFLADARKVTFAGGTTTTEYTYRIDPTQLPITELLDTDIGKYSIRMLNEGAAQDSNITNASGDFAVALGKGTKATKEASTALGDHTEATGKGAFAGGNEAKALEEGAVALGSQTIAKAKNALAMGSNVAANAENQVVIGKYNTEDNTQAFIIANGTNQASSNKFTVSYGGDVKALGTLEVKGNIKATGAANNLELGTDKNGAYGTITVFGTNTSSVFSVTKDGNTAIEGTLNVAGASILKNTLDVDKKTTLKNGLSVTAGNTELQTPLIVADNQNTTLGGDLAVKGNATIAASTSKTNSLTLGSSTDGVSGEFSIYGTGANKVFNVANTGDTTISGKATVEGATELKSTLEVTGATTIAGDLTVTGQSNLTLSGDTSLVKTTISGVTSITNTTGLDVAGDTAALKVAGGVKLGQSLHVGSNTSVGGTLSVAESTTLTKDVTISSATDYTSADSAALKVGGGVYISKKLHVAGQMSLADNLEITSTKVAIKAAAESTTANNGALVVNGGVGIGQNLNVNKNTVIAENLTVAGTSGKCNTLQLGNESTSNKGGELLIYGTGTTTIFSVDNAGNTGLEGNLAVKGNISSGNKLSIGSGTTAIEISNTGITGLAGLTVSGQIDAAVFNATSDARLKTNIEDYTFEKSILNLPIKRFEYIKDSSHTKYIGCLAQDLQEICPELVNKNSDGMLSIQESKLIYALLQEVKDLKGRVELLERG